MKVQCVLNPGKTLFSFYGACFASFCLLLRIFITHFCKSMSTIFALKGVKEGICHCEGNCMQCTIVIIFLMHYNVKIAEIYSQHTLFWLLLRKVQKIRICKFWILLKKWISSLALYSRDLKTTFRIELNQILVSE